MEGHRGARAAPLERIFPKRFVGTTAHVVIMFDRTGLGSYMDRGDQPSTWVTSDMITAARVGEQMKCKVVGRKSGVSVRS